MAETTGISWHPMSDADRDGTPILVTDGTNIHHVRYIVGSPSVAAYCWASIHRDDEAFSENDLTHFARAELPGAQP